MMSPAAPRWFVSCALLVLAWTGAARAMPAALSGRVVDENGVRLADRSKTPLTLAALSSLRADVSARLLREKHYGAELGRIDATNLKPLADAVTNGNVWMIDYNEMDGRLAHAALRRLRTYPWTVIVFEYDDVLMASVKDIWLGAVGFSMIVAIIAVSLGWMLGGMREAN